MQGLETPYIKAFKNKSEGMPFAQLKFIPGFLKTLRSMRFKNRMALRCSLATFGPDRAIAEHLGVSASLWVQFGSRWSHPVR